MFDEIIGQLIEVLIISEATLHNNTLNHGAQITGEWKDANALAMDMLQEVAASVGGGFDLGDANALAMDMLEKVPEKGSATAFGRTCRYWLHYNFDGIQSVTIVWPDKVSHHIDLWD